MEQVSLKFVASASGGEIQSGSPETTVSRVCTDSRQARPGDLFFALAGELFDGHNFLAEAAHKGVAAVVVERRKTPPLLNCGIIVVEDARGALGRLAANYRRQFSLPVVAVAGSNGKTTTKELLAAVLRQKMATVSSEASFNNDIGVPLTLLRLERAHEAAVLEAGTNHPGELAPLIEMIQPRHGVLTSIGREHLEFFGDLEGVAREEGCLAELLPDSGTLFLNGDSEWTPTLERRTKARVVRIGFGAGNDWRAENVRVDLTGVTFRVVGPCPGFDADFRVKLLGRHQALNALFAIAAGVELGLSAGEIRRGLASCEPPKMRMQLHEVNGVRVLDDTYNANVDSMLAALQTLRDLPCAGRRLAVLGDMAELGESTEAAHAEVGRLSADYGINCLVAIGRWARQTADAARAAGLREVTEFSDVQAAAPEVKKMVREGDIVLLKASRASGLERISEALRNGRG